VPRYQYACVECGHELEAVQSFTDDSLTVCPVCEGALRKVFSPVGVVFKGSGFYRTDSRSSSKEKSAAGSGSGSGSDDKAPAAAGSKGSSSSKDGSSSSSSGSSSSTPAPAAKSA
jgi:putative FmdB family regulatory protein